MTEEQYKAIKRAAQDDLLKIPGVHTVGLGAKTVNGQYTGEAAIRVYVTKKKPLNEILPDEVIPREINGVKTDVIESAQPNPEDDTDKYRPLKGGAQLAVTTDFMSGSNGTLGCMARTKDDDKAVILTNQHVVSSISKGDPICQPYFECNCSNCCPTVVAKLSKEVLSETVDGAIGTISDTDYKAQIVDIGNVKGTHTVTLAEAQTGTYAVRKRGRTTKTTYGIVDDIDADGTRTDGWIYKYQIGITATSPTEDGFSRKGDSGSVVVNESSEVVGLLWGSDGAKHADASPIQAVMDELEIEIMTSDSLVESPEQEDRDSRQTLAKLVLNDLQQSEAGRRYLEYFFRHNEEVRRLINANRRVAATWQRNHGPQIFQSLILTAQDPESTLPHEIEGRTLAACIDGILGALLKYGSTELQKDIVREAPDVSALGGLSYKQLLEYINTMDHELVG